MNGHRLEPNERKLPEIAPEAWDKVVEWRPHIYSILRRFGKELMGREITWHGRIGESDFCWDVSEPTRSVFGVDPAALMQDLEYRALEIAAVAITQMDKRTTKPSGAVQSWLKRWIERGLQDEFDRWILTSSSQNVVQLGLPEDRYAGVADPVYDPFAEPDDGLTEETRERLQAAMGALTSREAWALRMHADGSPPAVIAEALGLKGEKSVFKIIATAKKKAGDAYGDR